MNAVPPVSDRPRRTLDEWLALQDVAHGQTIDLGLERVGAVARALGVDRAPHPVITVGGTNGKGSTVAFLEAILRHAGVVTGAFTSPHLVRYNERIRIDGVPVDDAELISAFEDIEAARGGTTLTFFEYNTLAALLIFARRRVGVAILEVGLGGRLDATNLIDADVAVLCSVGVDHRDWLGDTLEAIGAEKAGIFRAERPAVLGSQEMPRSVFEAIERLDARAIVAERDFSWRTDGQRWSYTGSRTTLEGLPMPALAGEIQLRNASTALAALEALGMPRALERDTVAAALRSVQLPGRFQIVPGPVEWLLDVAHNEPAAQVLAQNLAARPVAGRTIAVCGILRDKDVAAIGRTLEPSIDTWIVCSIDDARGLPAAELVERLGIASREVELAESVEAGCRKAAERARPGDRVVVFGSFHTVGPALRFLQIY